MSDTSPQGDEPTPSDQTPNEPTVEQTSVEPTPVEPTAQPAPSTWPAAGSTPPPVYPAYPANPAESAAGGAYPAYPSYAPAAGAAQTSSNAIIALILAIVSWVVCPVIPAVVALVLAHSAAKEIAASGGRIQGAGLVTASRIVSWINIGFFAAVMVVGAFFLVLVAIAGATGDAQFR